MDRFRFCGFGFAWWVRVGGRVGCHGGQGRVIGVGLHIRVGWVDYDDVCGRAGEGRCCSWCLYM